MRGELNTQADVLVDLGKNAQLFHDDRNHGFASFRVNKHVETCELKSMQFQLWLTHSFYKETGRVPTSTALKSAVGVLEAIALYDDPDRKQIAIRVAEYDEKIYLDLHDRDRRAVEIDGCGWRVVSNPPVKFVRPPGMHGLPEPVTGGSVNDLRPFLNVANDDEFMMIIAFVLMAYHPHGPYPVLGIHGGGGAAKSTAARLIRALIDPNDSPLRATPKGQRDLMIMATKSRILGFDNESELKPWLSNALCRLSTGGGYSTRSLYTNDSETILDAKRPILLTGIQEFVTASDLLDRALIIDLQLIPDDRRKVEDEFWADFAKVHPRILGAILSAVSGALRNRTSVVLAKLPRLADFAKWVTAAEGDLRWAPGAFARAYDENRTDAASLSLDALFIDALDDACSMIGTFDGTATDLLDRMTMRAEKAAVKDKHWPRRPRHLSHYLRRLAPILRSKGYTIEFGERRGKARDRIIRVCLPDQSHMEDVVA